MLLPVSGRLNLLTHVPTYRYTLGISTQVRSSLVPVILYSISTAVLEYCLGLKVLGASVFLYLWLLIEIHAPTRSTTRRRNLYIPSLLDVS